MPRYIDADYLDELITRLNHEGRDITRNEYKMIDSVLFEFPTADVVERKVGKWDSDDNSPSYFCSCCGHHAYGSFAYIYSGRYKYCPFCGAEMEGMKGEEDAGL